MNESDVEIAFLEACRQFQQQFEDAEIVPPDHVENAAKHNVPNHVNHLTTVSIQFPSRRLTL